MTENNKHRSMKAGNFLTVLSENQQAQIAAYYNIDKTDGERSARNAVIQEYADLIEIYKSKNW